MSSEFLAQYQVADGYVGMARPLKFKIFHHDLADDMDESDLTSLYEELIQEHFERHVFPDSERLDEFLSWAKGVIGARSV